MKSTKLLWALVSCLFALVNFSVFLSVISNSFSCFLGPEPPSIYEISSSNPLQLTVSWRPHCGSSCADSETKRKPKKYTIKYVATMGGTEFTEVEESQGSDGFPYTNTTLSIDLMPNTKYNISVMTNVKYPDGETSGQTVNSDFSPAHYGTTGDLFSGL